MDVVLVQTQSGAGFASSVAVSGGRLQVAADEPVEATRRLRPQRRQTIPVRTGTEALSTSTRTAPLVRYPPAQREQVQRVAHRRPSVKPQEVFVVRQKTFCAVGQLVEGKAGITLLTPRGAVKKRHHALLDKFDQAWRASAFDSNAPGGPEAKVSQWIHVIFVGVRNASAFLIHYRHVQRTGERHLQSQSIGIGDLGEAFRLEGEGEPPLDHAHALVWARGSP